MPVEIKELKIKAVISPPVTSTKIEGNALTPLQFERMKNEIVKECVSQIKEYLKDQTER